MTAYEKLVLAIKNDSDDEIKEAVKELKVTDGSMISHEMLVRIAKALGIEVKEELPEDIKSDFWFRPISEDSSDDSDDSSDDDSDDSSDDDSDDSSDDDSSDDS